jgi:hypothetical protein
MSVIAFMAGAGSPYVPLIIGINAGGALAIYAMLARIGAALVRMESDAAPVDLPFGARVDELDAMNRTLKTLTARPVTSGSVSRAGPACSISLRAFARNRVVQHA